MTLESIGWTKQRQAEFVPYAAEGLVPGRVVGEHRTHYRVMTAATELSAEIRGRIRNTVAQRSDLPGVGDFVAIRPAAGDGRASVEVALQRTSALVRKAAGETRPQLLAANVDVVFIVTAPDGDFNLPRLERYLSLVRESGAAPVIVVNKSDLTDDIAVTTRQIAELSAGVPIHAISARGLAEWDVLNKYFEGNRTIVLVGSSGVGKSTITNRLMGIEVQATQDVRAHDSRGRHTTTHRQLFPRPKGGAIIDTPGIRGLELWNPEYDVDKGSEAIAALAADCRFRDCRHDSEPGCAVRAAIEQGKLEAIKPTRSG